MAPDTRVRFKVDVTPDVKTKVDMKGRRYRSGENATLPKDEADKLVKGGFADYLDESGNVIYEQNTRAEDTPAEGPTASARAKSIPEEARAKPAEYATADDADEAPAHKSGKPSKKSTR